MALTETVLCNIALSDIGAGTITDFDDDNSLEGRRCRLYYEPERDALLRSFYWPFAADRKSLTKDTDDDPAFEYDNQFVLPTDFMYLRTIFADNETIDRTSRNRYAIEGQRLLSNNSVVQIRYTKKVTDPTKFDPLFVQVLVKQLALKLTSLAGANPKIRESLKDDLRLLMPSVRALGRQEAELNRGLDWNDVRQIGVSGSGARRGSF